MVTSLQESPPSRGHDLLGCSVVPSASEGLTVESGVSHGDRTEQLISVDAVAPHPAGRQGSARCHPRPPTLWENTQGNMFDAM